MAAEACPRCSEEVTQHDRFCGRCGQRLVAGSFMLPAGEAMAAAQREKEWLAQTPAGGGEPQRVERSAADEPPFDDLVYWSHCVRVLRDQQSLALAQVAGLRRRCVELGMLESDLDARLAGAMAPFEVVDPSGGVAAAGWYPDPASSQGLRYWTGTTWTKRVS